MRMPAFTRSVRKTTTGASVALLLALAVPMLPGVSPAQADTSTVSRSAKTPAPVVQESWMKDVSISLSVPGTLKRGESFKATLTIVNNSKTYAGSIPVNLAVSMFDAKMIQPRDDYLTLKALRHGGGANVPIPLAPVIDPSARGVLHSMNPGLGGGRISFDLTLTASKSLPAGLIKGSMSAWVGREGSYASGDFKIAPASGGTAKPTTKPTTKPTNKPTTKPSTKPTTTTKQKIVVPAKAAGTTAPTTGATPTSTPATTTAAPTQPAAAVPTELPRTGAASSVPLSLAGGALVVLGGAALVGTRMRRRTN